MALAFNFTLLMFIGILQAIGMGILLPLLLDTILVIYPSEKQGAAMILNGLALLFVPATGPIIIGLLIHKIEWRIENFSWIMPISISVSGSL